MTLADHVVRIRDQLGSCVPLAIPKGKIERVPQQ
jgi:hypothetical protein